MANIKQLYEDNNKTVEAYPRVWLPVGSLYWNENDISADISKYFVGTWVRVKDVFILAAGNTYTAKTSGGEATHTLTVGEMPSHNHNMIYAGGNAAVGGMAVGYLSIPEFASQGYRYDYDTTHTEYTGSSQPHNNMPPYYVAYCWKRTA